MPASEIDDIFAAKGKATLPKPSTSKAASEAPPKKSKKSKKRKHEEAESAEPKQDEKNPSKRRVVTVVDPSSHLSAPTPASKPSRVLDKSSSTTSVKKTRQTANEDEERFKDSRGSGPRRTTEEGWSIYKENELGITDEGGDTPLCPFDCQCCF